MSKSLFIRGFSSKFEKTIFSYICINKTHTEQITLWSFVEIYFFTTLTKIINFVQIFFLIDIIAKGSHLSSHSFPLKCSFLRLCIEIIRSASDLAVRVVTIICRIFEIIHFIQIIVSIHHFVKYQLLANILDKKMCSLIVSHTYLVVDISRHKSGIDCALRQ